MLMSRMMNKKMKLLHEGERNPLSHFVKKSKGKKKKPGHRSAWRQEEVNDLVDIIVNNNYYQTKLIFENTKTQRNGILPEMKKRAAEREAEFKFNISQMRTRFKKCEWLQECSTYHQNCDRNPKIPRGPSSICISKNTTLVSARTGHWAIIFLLWREWVEKQYVNIYIGKQYISTKILLLLVI